MSLRDSREGMRASWDARYGGEHPVWRGPSKLDLDIPRGSTVMELGCGDGKTLISLLSEGHRVIGLDFSMRALASLRSRLPRASTAELVLGDVNAIPMADGSIDVLLAHHVLEHILERERRTAAREIARVLAPSGCLDVRAFSVDDMRRGKGKEVEKGTWLRDGIPHHYFTEEELASLLGGLTLEESRTDMTRKRYSGAVYQRAVICARFRRPQAEGQPPSMGARP